MRIYRNKKVWIYASRRLEKEKRHVRFGGGIGTSKLGRLRDIYLDLAFYKYKLRLSVSICFPNKELK